MLEGVEVVDAPHFVDVARLAAPLRRPLAGQLVGDAHRGLSPGLGVEPRLQDHGGRDLVDHLPPGRATDPDVGQGALGGHRREPLVVGLDGHANHGSEGGDLLPGGSRRRAVVAGEAEREADDDQLGLLVPHDGGDPLVVVTARPTTRDDGQG